MAVRCDSRRGVNVGRVRVCMFKHMYLCKETRGARAIKAGFTPFQCDPWAFPGRSQRPYVAPTTPNSPDGVYVEVVYQIF